jgi:hypothetical protein
LTRHSELYQLARYTLDQYRGTPITCRYAIPSKIASEGKSLTSIVTAAIAHVISKAPTLQVGISGAESKKPVWIDLGSVDLDQHVKWVSLEDSVDSDHSMQERIQLELDTRFFELGIRPGWRIVVLQHTEINFLDILFVCNHPHGDGMSGKILHESLLEHLNTATEGPVGPQDVGDLTLQFLDTSSRFPPATEQLVELPISPNFLLKAVWDDNKPISLFKTPHQADWAPICTSLYKTQFQTFAIGSTILANVLAACRRHKTTVTGLLNSLVLISLSSNLDESRASAFASGTAIDQRRFLPSHPPDYPWFEPKRTIANYVSIMAHEYDRALVAQIRSYNTAMNANGDESLSDELLDLLWSTSRRVRNDIETKLRTGLKNDSIGLMKFVPDWRAQFRSDAKKPRKLSWFISNLGVLDGKAAPNTDAPTEGLKDLWSIRRAQFTISTEVPVAALLFTAMTVKDEQLVVACRWQDTVVEANLVKQLLADMRKWLTQVGRGS